MEAILIFGGALVFTLAMIWGLRAIAKKVGSGGLAEASAAFSTLVGFKPDDVLIYLNSAIAWDGSSGGVAIWEKATGARRVSPGEVGAWHSGTLLTLVIGRTTATPMVQLFGKPGDVKPFFKVGVLDQTVCPVWAERLGKAFGADRERDIDVKLIGQ